MGMPKKPGWAKQWSGVGRSLMLLETWDAARGILLVCHDNSCDEALDELLVYFDPDEVIHLEPEASPAEWHKALLMVREKAMQAGLFDGPIPDRICIVLRNMERCSERNLNQLKGLFERSARPFNCLATTRDRDAIDSKHSSYFFEWRKIGRPRRDT